MLSVDIESREAPDGLAFPFASTRYYGSKRRQIDWIAENLLELSPKNALDPMGGTGTVTHALSVLGVPVTYCDAFRFNVMAAKGLFDSLPVEKKSIQRFLNSINPAQGVISNNFSGYFFTDDENAWLDGFFQRLQDESEVNRNALFYAITQACLKKRPYNLFHRANLYMRTANVTRSFGNLTTWNTPFEKLIMSCIDEINLVRRSLSSPVTIKSERDATEHSNIYDLVYLDPPYFKENRYIDSYMRRYHFLEGLAHYPNWASKIDHRSPIHEIDKKYHPREWSSCTDVVEGINQVARKYSKATIVISYVLGQSPSIEMIRSRLLELRSKVKIVSIPARTALSAKARDEVLIIGSY